jgi:hypothetical protein
MVIVNTTNGHPGGEGGGNHKTTRDGQLLPTTSGKPLLSIPMGSIPTHAQTKGKNGLSSENRKP